MRAQQPFDARIGAEDQRLRPRQCTIQRATPSRSPAAAQWALAPWPKAKARSEGVAQGETLGRRVLPDPGLGRPGEPGARPAAWRRTGGRPRRRSGCGWPRTAASGCGRAAAAHQAVAAAVVVVDDRRPRPAPRARRTARDSARWREPWPSRRAPAPGRRPRRRRSGAGRSISAASQPGDGSSSSSRKAISSPWRRPCAALRALATPGGRLVDVADRETAPRRPELGARPVGRRGLVVVDHHQLQRAGVDARLDEDRARGAAPGPPAGAGSG